MMSSHPLAAVALAASLMSVAGGTVWPPQPGGAGKPGDKGQPEPKTITLTPARVFTDVRDDLRKGPLAQRLAVTVTHKGRTPSSATLLLRTAPGKERDQRDAKVSIEAGELRIFAEGGEGGQITAIITSNPTTYYRVDLQGPPTLAAVSKALHPLPLPELAVFFADGDAVTDPTPLTRGITWQPVIVPIEPNPPITLTGTIDGKPGAAMGFEWQTVQRDKQKESLLRVRSFTCPLAAPAGEERTLTITSAWIDPGDPASWKLDVTTPPRTRVDSLAALGIRIEPPPAPPALSPPTAPSTPPAEPKKPELPSPNADPATPPVPKPE